VSDLHDSWLDIADERWLGQNELEASIMLSKPPSTHPSIPSTRRGLGLSLLTRAKNPSKLARALYLHPEHAPHAFLSGTTAEDIGHNLGEELVDSSYFYTEHRWREHRRGLGLPEEPLPQAFPQSSAYTEHTEQDPPSYDEYPRGTVGAVALDIRGCIAAVTSTGGRTNKLPGRIGDTPIVGAGFWAEEWHAEKSSESSSLLPKWMEHAFSAIWPGNKGGNREKETIAMGASGTGDGDVSPGTLD